MPGTVLVTGYKEEKKKKATTLREFSSKWKTQTYKSQLANKEDTFRLTWKLQIK